MFKKESSIYLDYAASTPVSKKAFMSMKPWLDGTHFGNASSIHERGRKAQKAISDARATIAQAMGASNNSQIIFTSGGTESNVLALIGATKAGDTIVVSEIEHSSIRELSDRYDRDFVFLPVDKRGLIDTDKLLQIVKNHKPKMVSIQLVNNEIGVVQNIKKITKLVKAHDKAILMHTDASQAFCHNSCHVDSLGIDLMTLCSQKVYGPQGIGLLYVAPDVKLSPLFPGSQEFGIRAGTESVALIAGFAQALKDATGDRKRYIQATMDLQVYLFELLERNNINYVLSGVDPLPRATSLSFPDIDLDSEKLVSFFNTKGIQLSSKSACMGAHAQKSYVQQAINNDAEKNIRISIGRSSKRRDIEKLVSVIKELC